MQCFVLTALMTLIWIVCGYSFAFDDAGMAEGMTPGNQILAQFISGIVSLILLKILDRTLGLRVTQEGEIAGLDITLHDEQGYNL